VVRPVLSHIDLDELGVQPVRGVPRWALLLHPKALRCFDIEKGPTEGRPYRFIIFTASWGRVVLKRALFAGIMISPDPNI
jgi:hypothetical protein